MIDRGVLGGDGVFIQAEGDGTREGGRGEATCGAAYVAAALGVAPARVTVPSGQERSIRLSLDLDAASFSAGERYSCTVEVSGGDQATIEVTIDVGT